MLTGGPNGPPVLRDQARIQGGGGLGPASTPGTERVPSSQGQKEGILVPLE